MKEKSLKRIEKRLDRGEESISRIKKDIDGFKDLDIEALKSTATSPKLADEELPSIDEIEDIFGEELIVDDFDEADFSTIPQNTNIDNIQDNVDNLVEENTERLALQQKQLEQLNKKLELMNEKHNQLTQVLLDEMKLRDENGNITNLSEEMVNDILNLNKNDLTSEMKELLEGRVAISQEAKESEIALKTTLNSIINEALNRTLLEEKEKNKIIKKEIDDKKEALLEAELEELLQKSQAQEKREKGFGAASAVSELEKTERSIYDEITTDSEFAETGERIVQAKERVGNVENKITTAKDRISMLQEKVDSIKGRIQSVEERLIDNEFKSHFPPQPAPAQPENLISDDEIEKLLNLSESDTLNIEETELEAAESQIKEEKQKESQKDWSRPQFSYPNYPQISISSISISSYNYANLLSSYSTADNSCSN